MKVLFATGNSPDYLAGTLWDGLRSALGPDNVADAVDSAYLRGLHEDWSGPDPSAVLLVSDLTRDDPLGRGKSCDTHRLPASGEDDFDLLVATTSFLRDQDWQWLADLRGRRLKKGGKLAWVETLDSPAEIFPPPFGVDAVFRREIDPAVPYEARYGRKPLPLLGAAPRRWFDWPQENKDIDVFAVSSAVTPLPGFPQRWEALRKVFETLTKHTCLAGSGRFDLPDYLKYLCRSRLCVVAPGGGESSDGPRQWEAVAAGAIPVFVSQPCRVRWPWFSYQNTVGAHCFFSSAAHALPSIIDGALKENLPAVLARLREHALAFHTTEARAGQFLALVGSDAWKKWDQKPWCW